MSVNPICIKVSETTGPLVEINPEKGNSVGASSRIFTKVEDDTKTRTVEILRKASEAAENSRAFQDSPQFSVSEKIGNQIEGFSRSVRGFSTPEEYLQSK